MKKILKLGEIRGPYVKIYVSHVDGSILISNRTFSGHTSECIFDQKDCLIIDYKKRSLLVNNSSNIYLHLAAAEFLN